MEWETPLLRHVLAEVCTDPDCEVHNIDIAIEEEVVSPFNVAYFCAGFMKAGGKPEELLEMLGPTGRAIYGS